MKRFALVATMLFAFVAGVFAQADLQPLVTIKLNKSETITLKQLKSRVETYQKQSPQKFTVAQKKEILEAMIQEKLVVQAAQKAGLAITDTQVNQYFLQSLSQMVGQVVTEAQFAELIKKNTGLSFDDYMKQQLGMNVAEYKSYLKNQLISQQYVIQQKGAEIQKIAATDSEIRKFYDLNKSSFVQNDMLKLFLIIVPKGNDINAAKAKADSMLSDLKNKKTTFDSIKANSANETSFQGGELIVAKTAQHAQQLGVSYDDLIKLFEKNVGYISDLTETKNDFQFYAVRQKYGAKMLSISDSVQPEATVTVYDYIKQNLTAQKQQQALMMAVNNLVVELDTPANVDRKKTGDALDKLLDW